MALCKGYQHEQADAIRLVESRRRGQPAARQQPQADPAPTVPTKALAALLAAHRRPSVSRDPIGDAMDYPAVFGRGEAREDVPAYRLPVSCFACDQVIAHPGDVWTVPLGADREAYLCTACIEAAGDRRLADACPALAREMERIA